MLFVEPGRKTEIGQLDMTVLVNQDVVRLDISVAGHGWVDSQCLGSRKPARCLPMDKTEVMHGLNRKNALGDVEPRHVLREGIVLDQHRHQVSSSQELHDEIQVCRVLE